MAGAAIGDSMGSAVEFLHYKAIRKYFGNITDLSLSKGKFTDDTALRYLLYLTIIEKGRRINAWDLASKWITDVIPEKTYWITELFISAELLMGRSPRETGFHNIDANDAAMMVDPVGVVNCCNPRNAALDARDIGSICQKGAELEAAMAIAAAVAKAFEPEVSIEEIIEAAETYSSPLVKARIEKALEASCSSSDIYEALYESVAIDDGSDKIVRIWRKKDPRLAKYNSEDISLGVSALEVVPVALAFFYISKGEPLQTIRLSVNYGRDSDTIAGIGGAIAGAFSGARNIDPRFIEQINLANEVSLESLAMQMIKPIQNSMLEAEKSITLIKKLLE